VTNYLYSPAPTSAWIAVACDEKLVVVNSQDPELLSQLWSEVANGMQAAVGVLTARGLANTPAFALVHWSGTRDRGVTAHVIVRGAVEVAITTATGVVNLSGIHVSTWSEHNIDGASACEVTTDAASQEFTLPLVAGVVPVQRVRCSLTATALAADMKPEASQLTVVAAVASTSMLAATPTIPATPTAAAAARAEQVPVSEATIVDRPSSEGAAAVDTPPEAVGTADGDTDFSAAGGIGIDDNPVGETVFRHISEPVAVESDQSTPENDVQTSVSADDGGDHDGMTIMTGDIRKLRAGRSSPGAAAQAASVESAPASTSLFLELSTGSREVLNQPILVGRAPSVSKVSGGALPRLVTIPGDKDISRNHVQLVVEGGTVVVTDLHSRNGTHVVLPGKAPQRLRAGEPTAVIVGTVVDLGGDVTFTVCEGT
jgi:hypothetical protein